MHLYIHIPFCHEICPYCSFYKHKPGKESQGEFIDAILKELEGNDLDYSDLKTIYLGGGTPSLLSPTNLSKLFKGLQEALPFGQCLEIGMEANPSTFDLKKAKLIKELGVNRVSLGVQSFDPEQLKVLGRDHSREGAIESFQILRAAGIPSINIDLMFSTPGQTITSWEKTLETAIELKPDHLSCYNLTYEEDTEYFKKFISGEYTDEPDLNESLFSLADRMLNEAGFQHYETSNYAQPNHRSVHNSGYWKGANYLGLGPSAVSCIDRQRRKNISDTAAYIKRVHSVGHAMDEHENLDNEAWRLERLALELRTVEGCSLEYVELEQLDQLIEHNLITTTETRFITTKKGSALVDSIVDYLA